MRLYKIAATEIIMLIIVNLFVERLNFSDFQDVSFENFCFGIFSALLFVEVCLTETSMTVSLSCPMLPEVLVLVKLISWPNSAVLFTITLLLNERSFLSLSLTLFNTLYPVKIIAPATANPNSMKNT